MNYFLLLFRIALLGLLGGGITLTSHALTLEHYIQDSQKMPEFPTPDNSDPSNYYYSSFHQKNEKKLFALNPMKVFEHKNWDKEHFVDLLSQVLNHCAKDNPIYCRNAYLYKQAKLGDHFVVWGDLHGAFHSLVREFSFLRDEGIIDNQFKILKPDYYFIFLGNVLNRSPYNLETVSFILEFLLQNPDQVSFFQGRHERQDYWFNYNLKQELIDRFSDQSIFDVPYREQINLVFNQLNNGFILHDVEKDEFVLMSPNEWQGRLNLNILNEASSKAKTEEKSNQILSLVGDDLYDSSDAQYTDKMIFQLGSKLDLKTGLYFRPTGLDPYLGFGGVKLWSVFSSPIQSFAEIFNFTRDSFIMLEVRDSLAKSPLYQFSRERPDKEKLKTGFSKIVYHPLLGRVKDSSKIDPFTQDRKEVRLFSSLDLSGQHDTKGHQIAHGNSLRLFSFQDQQEMPLVYLRYFLLDDKGKPTQLIENYRIAHDIYKAPYLMHFMENTNVLALQEYFISNNVQEYIFFPFIQAEKIRHDLQTGFVFFGPTFRRETEALLEYAFAHLLQQKVAIFYEHELYDLSFDEFKSALYSSDLHLNKENSCIISIDRDQSIDDKIVNQIRECEADTLLFVSTFDTAKNVLGTLGLEKITDYTIFTLSDISQRIKKFIQRIDVGKKQRDAIHLVMSHKIFNPLEDQNAYNRRFTEVLDFYYPGIEPNLSSFEAYVTMDLFIEGLKNAVDISQAASSMDYLQGQSEIKLQDYVIPYFKNLKTFSQDVYIEDSRHDQWIQISPDS